MLQEIGAKISEQYGSACVLFLPITCAVGGVGSDLGSSQNYLQAGLKSLKRTLPKCTRCRIGEAENPGHAVRHGFLARLTIEDRGTPHTHL